MEQHLIYKMRHAATKEEIVCKISMVNGWEHKGFDVVGYVYKNVNIPLSEISPDEIDEIEAAFNPLDQSTSKEKFKTKWRKKR